MTFKYQASPTSELEAAAAADRHSVLIEGPAGCGKTYLASEYARMIGTTDFVSVSPTVSDIRQLVDTTSDLSNPMVINIENLDNGVSAAAYALLKFLEEPKSNVYVVVTCRNIRGVPDTIISRSVCISVGVPTPDDLTLYAMQKDSTMFQLRSSHSLWSACVSFSDIDTLFKLSIEQLDYFTELSQLKYSDTVSNLSWRLGHYKDNSETPVGLVVRCIYITSSDSRIRGYALQCLSELDNSHVASHAVISNFIFNCKYGGI